MKIYLIRHTSVSVHKGICYGQTDVPLSCTFAGELEAVKLQLQNTELRHVYSSPLTRCLRLAQEFSTKETIITDQRLKEMNFGDWEMKTWDTIENSNEGKAWFADFANKACPNGESFVEMTARAQSFLTELLNKHKNGENIGIFTHAGVIRSFISITENIPLEETFNTKISYGQVYPLKMKLQ